NWQYISRHIAMTNQQTEPNYGDILDHETGEPVQINSVNQPIYICRTNEETGELEKAPLCSENREKRKTFQVPKTALAKYQPTMNSNLLALAELFNDDEIRPQYYCPATIEEKFLHDTHNISPIVFLLPTFFLFPFPAWLTVISIIVELCLHMWAHKINKDCKDPDLMYRSPLHILTSQFCAFCKSKRYMKRVGKLQDARALKVYSRKPTYVERISVMT
ncbi:hypothetical protein L9F63_026566, partial [Diploptera punctata]